MLQDDLEQIWSADHFEQDEVLGKTCVQRCRAIDVVWLRAVFSERGQTTQWGWVFLRCALMRLLYLQASCLADTCQAGRQCVRKLEQVLFRSRKPKLFNAP